MSLNLSGIPASAQRIAITITPAAGGTAKVEGDPVIMLGQSQAVLTPDSLGTWSYTFSARDPSGVEVGTATGTFEVVEAPAFAPVTMNATVTY